MSKRKGTRTSKSVSFTHKRQRSRIPVLPEEIIINIINRESAEFLHNVGRLVCKSWATIISKPKFIEMNLSHSNSIVLFNNSTPLEPLKLLELMVFEKFKPRRSYFDRKVQGKLLDSYIGLMLYEDPDCLYVVNSITGQISKIPHSPIKQAYKRKFNVLYSPLTKQVKVICHYFNPENDRFSWKVFTIGSDNSWRILKNKTVNLFYVLSIRRSQEPSFFSFSVGGVVICWSSRRWFYNKHFLVIDLDNESFHMVYGLPFPMSFDQDIIPMENQLYVISRKSEDVSYVGQENRITVWKMEDFRQNEWVEVFSIDMDDMLESFRVDKVWFSVAWLENYKILIFKTLKGTIKAYDFKLRKKYQISEAKRLPKRYYEYLPHTNSLISW